MSLCQVTNDVFGRWYCPQCGREHAKQHAKQYRSCAKGGPDAEPPRPANLECRNRGDKVRGVTVEACCGSTWKMPIYACVKHGECTKDKRIEGVKFCDGCKDLSPH